MAVSNFHNCSKQLTRFVDVPELFHPIRLKLLGYSPWFRLLCGGALLRGVYIPLQGWKTPVGPPPQYCYAISQVSLLIYLHHSYDFIIHMQ